MPEQLQDKQLRMFDDYSQLIIDILLFQVHKEFAQNSEDLTVEKLMEMFISSKTTGTEKPGMCINLLSNGDGDLLLS